MNLQSFLSYLIFILILFSIFFLIMGILLTICWIKEVGIIPLIILGNAGSILFWITYGMANLLKLNRYHQLASIFSPISICLFLLFLGYSLFQLVYTRKFH